MVNPPETKTYSQCIELIQRHLKHIALTHGAIKQWCIKEELDYKAIIKIKNGSMKFYLPKLVLKLLDKFGYRASISRNYTVDEIEDIFIVQKTDNTPTDNE